MKVLLIRHGEPDFEHNCLTKLGETEAQALSNYFKDYKFDDIYSSPYPRAYLTAKAVIKDESKIKVVDFLKEFDDLIPCKDEVVRTRDFLPSYVEKHPELFEEEYLIKHPEIKQILDNSFNGIDAILEKHGYKRNGDYFDVTDSNEKTIVLFCHFGEICVLLAHFFDLSIIKLSQFTCCPPTGIVELRSEEREKGKALFKLLSFGETPHLAVANMKPSFFGRFCEIFDSKDRH